MRLTLIFLFFIVWIEYSYGQWVFHPTLIETTDEDIQINNSSPELKFNVNDNLPFIQGLAGSIKGIGGLSLGLDMESTGFMTLTANTRLDIIAGQGLYIGNDQNIFTHMSNNGFWAFGDIYPDDRIHIEGNIRIKDSGRLQWYDQDDRKAFVLFDGNDLFLTNEDDDSAAAGDIIINAKDDLQIVNNNNFSITIDEQNRVGIGTTSPSYQLEIMGDIGFTGELTAASDRRLKTNIEPVKNAIEVISKLNPVSYNFRTSEFPELKLSEELKLGLIAQEVEEVLPLLVSSSQFYDSGKQKTVDIKSVNYMELVPLRISSVQELSRVLELERINNQERIKMMEKDIHELRKLARDKDQLGLAEGEK